MDDRDYKRFTDSILEKELEGIVEEFDNTRFMVLREEAVNAYAYLDDGVKVVALTEGSFYHCRYAANLFMLKDSFFPDIGTSSDCHKEVSPSLFPVKKTEEGDLIFPVSGSEERSNVGDIITSLAMRFIAYHEIGHHLLGHLEKQGKAFGLDYGEANAFVSQTMEADTYKKMEMEADIFSVQMILGEIEDLIQKWSPLFEAGISRLELVMLLVVALVIVKEGLGEEALLEEDYDTHPYLPKFIRLIINLTAVVMGDHGELLEELEEELREVLDTDSRTRKIVESGYKLIATDNMPKRMASLILYLSNVAVCSEQTYKEIFYGTYSPMVFWEDLKAAKWWIS